MCKILVSKVDEVYFKLSGLDVGQSMELKEYLSCMMTNYFFHPKFRTGQWDGRLSFFNWNEQTIPIGLWPQFIKYCKKYNHEYEIDFDVNEVYNPISDEDIEKFYKAIFKNTSFYPRDYQHDAILKALRNKRGIIESATGSGKSLMLYSIIRFLLGTCEGKILLIVPNVSLVNQMYSDFGEYGWDSVATYCSKIFHKSDKIDWDCPIIISTWQSIYKKSEKFFEQFEAVLVDECLHGDSLITLSDGSKKKIKEMKIGDEVLSYNTETMEIETDVVLDVYENLYKSNNEDMFEIEIENGKRLKLTGNHEVLTQRGMVQIKKLNINDDITSFETMKLKSIRKIDKPEKVYNLHVEKNHNYFANDICVSNCHGAKAGSIQKCLKKCVNAEYRIGCTGTLPDELDYQYTIYGYLGPRIFSISSSELIDRGVLSKIKIANMVIRYPKNVVQSYWHDNHGKVYQDDYQQELSLLYGIPERHNVFKYIIDHCKPDENFLILCHRIDHLNSLEEYFKKYYSNREVSKIYMKTSAKDRERIRKEANIKGSQIILGTYSTMSTGLNIPRLHHVIFASSYRSKIKVLQSIGRGLRTHDTKNKLIVWDIVDDITWDHTWRGKTIIHKNYMYKHWEERKKYYKAQGFKHITKKINIDAINI